MFLVSRALGRVSAALKSQRRPASLTGFCAKRSVRGNQPYGFACTSATKNAINSPDARGVAALLRWPEGLHSNDPVIFWNGRNPRQGEREDHARTGAQDRSGRRPYLSA